MLVQWSNRAQEDMAHIVAYIAEDNPDAAERMEERIYRATALLTEQPGIGRSGHVDGTRELVIGGTSYIVPYRVRSHAVEIVAVMHAAQQWPKDFD
ncbi:MAG: type II toxin-antitoxin system RelE/ParE family toxin [Chloroflexota bacterium]|nr:type II toxin-antitoxin system RelE/ParE family toxin [Chloroflexota bacterium]